MVSCFCNFVVLYSWLEAEERSEKLVGASFLWRSTVDCLLVGHPFAAVFSVTLPLESWYAFVRFNFIKKSSVTLQALKCSNSLLSWHLWSTACAFTARSGWAFYSLLYSLLSVPCKTCSELSTSINRDRPYWEWEDINRWEKPSIDT